MHFLAFKFFDKENKGIISFDSFLNIFKENINKEENNNIDIKEELKKILKDIGIKNDDLSLDFSSFCELLSKILK